MIFRKTVPAGGSGPEHLVTSLAERLRSHVLWDSLLICIPPAIAAVLIAFACYRAAWLSPLAFLFVALGIAGFAGLAVVLRYRPLAPSLPAAAQIIDKQAESKDRFLTLATLANTSQRATFVARLRQETSHFGERIQFGRDFPYRFKQSFYRSIAISLAATILFHFLIPVAASVISPLSVQQQLRQIAAKMAQKESLRPLARELQALAAKLDDAKVTPEEKQAATEELEKKIEDQTKKEKEKENRDLLSQAANTLTGAEQQQSSSGDQQKKDQDKGGGGIQSNLPQEGKGQGKQSEGGGADSKGEQSAQMSNDMKQGKSAQGNPKEKGEEKNQQAQGDTKSDQRDPTQPGKEQNNEKVGKNQGASKEGAGKNQSPEEPPQGAPPAERFYKAGEGKEGLKGAGYVTVQLPEDVVADSKAEGKATKESGKGNRARPQIPVSNAPLPAHVPSAPTEKQQMPIEYRGIIR
ncbi:MAG TPA: hypothetical protein VFK65_22305 [Candidatus Binatia bacterium]|nr:hypothetical protein [Candidatus Binatia bacterium]